MSRISSVTSSASEQNKFSYLGMVGQEQGTLDGKMLLVKWEIEVRRGAWASARAIAKAIIVALPNEVVGWIYQAFAEQQLGDTSAARQTLLLAARKFPQDWRVAYNLACYNAQLGDRGGALNWLDRASEIGDSNVVESCASQDPKLISLCAFA